MSPDIGNQPVVIYVAIIVFALTALGTAIPKALGPISKFMGEWSTQRRVAAIERDDADIADMKRQVAYLTRRLHRMDEREQRWRRELNQHVAWDTTAITVASRHGAELPPVPPLMTPDPEEAETNHG